MIKEKFDRVSLDRELRANADGMPVVRKCLKSEILMSFLDDEGAEDFNCWWFSEGSRDFQAWLNAKTGTKTPGKFHKVEFLGELKLLTEDNPSFRRCFEHEIMLEFSLGNDAEMFREWWDDKASCIFMEWLNSQY